MNLPTLNSFAAFADNGPTSSTAIGQKYSVVVQQQINNCDNLIAHYQGLIKGAHQAIQEQQIQRQALMKQWHQLLAAGN